MVDIDEVINTVTALRNRAKECGYNDYADALTVAIGALKEKRARERIKYDTVDEYPNCTVQVLTDSKTGECSIGWWQNGT